MRTRAGRHEASAPISRCEARDLGAGDLVDEAELGRVDHQRDAGLPPAHRRRGARSPLDRPWDSPARCRRGPRRAMLKGAKARIRDTRACAARHRSPARGSTCWPRGSAPPAPRGRPRCGEGEADRRDRAGQVGDRVRHAAPERCGRLPGFGDRVGIRGEQVEHPQPTPAAELRLRTPCGSIAPGWMNTIGGMECPV